MRAEADRLRLEIRLAEGDMHTKNFIWDLRTGGDTFKRKGVASDCMRACGNIDYAHEFIALYGAKQTFDCHFSVYTHHEAVVLCRAWCHRMEWYLALWREGVDATGVAPTFTPADDTLYIEPDFFTCEVGLWGDKPKLLQRVRQIRSVCPRAPIAH